MPQETRQRPPPVQEPVQALPCLPDGQEFDGAGGVREARLQHGGGVRANTKPGPRQGGHEGRGGFRWRDPHSAARGRLAVQLEEEGLTCRFLENNFVVCILILVPYCSGGIYTCVR
ncbi:unnamed protein product, partial [Ectocarpus fasciculatus]